METRPFPELEIQSGRGRVQQQGLLVKEEFICKQRGQKFFGTGFFLWVRHD
jgi:hypothetical protein